MQTPKIQIAVSVSLFGVSICLLDEPPKFVDLRGAYGAPAATHSAVLLPGDPERPKGPERERSEPEKERACGRQRTREKASESSPGGPLQPITPAGLLSLWVHTASDCPPPSLSSLPIHTEKPSRSHCFQGCTFTLRSEKCFFEILPFSVFASFLGDSVSVTGGILAVAHNYQ